MTDLMLVDGNSLTYRAFFALPTDLSTASGQITNAVFGFTSMLLNLIRDHQPEKVIIAFDRPEPTFRHERLDSYKANRDSAPDILRQQMGLVRQVVDTFAIPVVEMVGFEADDLIATLATAADLRGEDVLVVTGDRDSYQLVNDPHIKVLYNKRGVSDYALYDEAGILDRTGVRPADYLNYAALRGDKSDNLPGVPGVGEKTAAKLINKYGGIDGIFENLADQTPKLRENLGAAEDLVRTNVELMDLVRDVPLNAPAEEFEQGEVDTTAVLELFKFLEFPSLVPRLAEAFPDLFGEGSPDAEQFTVLEAEVTVVESAGALGLLRKELQARTSTVVAAGWTGEPGRSELSGLAVVTDAEAGEVAWLPGDLLRASESRQTFQALLDENPVVAHDAKPLIRSLLAIDLDVASLGADTKLAAYLLDPAEGTYALNDLLARYAAAELATEGDAPEGEFNFDPDALPPHQVIAREALGVYVLAAPIAEALEVQGLADLDTRIEVPLVHVLAKMEHLGVGVDRSILENLLEELTARCDAERAAIISEAGGELNVNSTKQMREVLYERLGLPVHKKTKTGPSTDQQTLEKLKGEHPIIDHILAYREVEKLRSTYGTGLLAEIAGDGRIHATFNQTVARTGRLSSDQPNLHNIPVRSEEGRRFRKAFVPADGYEYLVADYNQIELRCIAHLAEDPGLIEAFTSGDDIHSRTASRVFGVDATEVSTEQRSKAKMVSYGLAYGMEAYGLAQRLNIGREEAQEILDAYFEAFPSVADFMESTVAEARERGYTETEFGRRRQIPELSSNQRQVRAAGERQAMNAPIQGLAADIFKVALVRLDAALSASDSASRLILQVHDEVVLEVPPQDWDATEAIVVEALSGAFDLRVPLEINLSRGMSWAEAKG